MIVLSNASRVFVMFESTGLKNSTPSLLVISNLFYLKSSTPLKSSVLKPLGNLLQFLKYCLYKSHVRFFAIEVNTISVVI